VIVNNDIEAWLLFAPFWLLGIAALIGGLWHMAHAWLVTRRVQAAGHGVPDHRRHHLRRGFIWLGAFVALTLMGIGVGAAVGLILGR
jgi:hypothetical protein